MKPHTALLAIAIAAAALVPSARADGDATAGADIARKKCLTCHTVEKGRNRVGPSLFGILGRKAGAEPDFNYSKSYVAAGDGGLIWSPETIFDYLADPKAFLRTLTKNPGAQSRMTFRLRDEAERKDVLAYLKTLR